MADEQQPLGILSIIIIIFLTLVVLGVMGGVFFPDSFLGQPPQFGHRLAGLFGNSG